MKYNPQASALHNVCSQWYLVLVCLSYHKNQSVGVASCIYWQVVCVENDHKNIPSEFSIILPSTSSLHFKSSSPEHHHQLYVHLKFLFETGDQTFQESCWSLHLCYDLRYRCRHGTFTYIEFRQQSLKFQGQQM